MFYNLVLLPPHHTVTAGDLRLKHASTTSHVETETGRALMAFFTAVQECDSAPAQRYHPLYVSVWVCQV